MKKSLQEWYKGDSNVQERLLHAAAGMIPKPESYKSALLAYLDSHREGKHIDPNLLTQAEQETMRTGIVKEIAERRGIDPDEYNFLLENFGLMKEEKLVNEGGLPKLGVLVSRINNSPLGKEFSTWLEAAKMSAEQTYRDLIKSIGLNL